MSIAIQYARICLNKKKTQEKFLGLLLFQFLWLVLHDVCCLRPAIVVDDIERNGCAFLQRAETITLDAGKMDKNIITVVTFDKAIAFF